MVAARSRNKKLAAVDAAALSLPWFAYWDNDSGNAYAVCDSLSLVAVKPDLDEAMHLLEEMAEQHVAFYRAQPGGVEGVKLLASAQTWDAHLKQLWRALCVGESNSRWRRGWFLIDDAGHLSRT